MNETVGYYGKNAQQYYHQTVDVDMSALYKPFLALLPPSGRILDAGCGSGRDSRHFKQHGYQVEAFDASLAMCQLASAHLGQPVQQKTFHEIEWEAEFDGVWACASLLHVSRASIDTVLEKLCRSLKPNGVMFTSFKLRNEEWSQDGRFFNGYDESSYPQLFKRHPALLLRWLWVSADERPVPRNERWLNGLLQRVVK